MATRPVRIELRGLTSERQAAQRDLEETVEALGEKLLPQRAARRLVQENNPAVVLTGLVALGFALGLARDETPRGRTMSLIAASVAGAAAFSLWRK
jgi:hypothetical protein